MTIAQTKAARRRFQTYYRKDGPIGTPRYKRSSVDTQQRKLNQQLEKLRQMAARKGARKK